MLQTSSTMIILLKKVWHRVDNRIEDEKNQPKANGFPFGHFTSRGFYLLYYRQIGTPCIRLTETSPTRSTWWKLRTNIHMSNVTDWFTRWCRSQNIYCCVNILNKPLKYRTYKPLQPKITMLPFPDLQLFY